MKLKKYSYLLVFALIMFVGIEAVYGVGAQENIVTCNDLFGSGEGSLRELINDILQYPKYIVPIIIIVLGTLDFAKATFAAKEDEMRKAQSTFIKRVLIGVVIFLVPTLVDIFMYLADIIWEELGYSSCDLSNIFKIK